MPIESKSATYTCDDSDGEPAYYFAPDDRARPPLRSSDNTKRWHQASPRPRLGGMEVGRMGLSQCVVTRWCFPAEPLKWRA